MNGQCRKGCILPRPPFSIRRGREASALLDAVLDRAGLITAIELLGVAERAHERATARPNPTPPVSRFRESSSLLKGSNTS